MVISWYFHHFCGHYDGSDRHIMEITWYFLGDTMIFFCKLPLPPPVMASLPWRLTDFVCVPWRSFHAVKNQVGANHSDARATLCPAITQQASQFEHNTILISQSWVIERLVVWLILPPWYERTMHDRSQLCQQHYSSSSLKPHLRYWSGVIITLAFHSAG